MSVWAVSIPWVSLSRCNTGLNECLRLFHCKTEDEFVCKEDLHLCILVYNFVFKFTLRFFDSMPREVLFSLMGIVLHKSYSSAINFLRLDVQPLDKLGSSYCMTYWTGCSLIFFTETQEIPAIILLSCWT